MRTFQVSFSADTEEDTSFFVQATSHLEAAELYVAAILDESISVGERLSEAEGVVVNQIPKAKATARVVPWSEIHRITLTFDVEEILDRVRPPEAEGVDTFSM